MTEPSEWWSRSRCSIAQSVNGSEPPNDGQAAIARITYGDVPIATTRGYQSTEERRRQMIDATSGVIAEHGFAATSFARIREVAGLSSTRMISHHFVDKAALMGRWSRK
ncbi:TetR family transcriptional regulator [Leifsonia sp. PS1209]|uniref:TetR family transcriptional regulator n=1 Tax=Leifsonia sp. PS1209 TaxID=2724914 RepID=UPI001FF9EE09|nr:TetR family transcriptional regulator [Leifsonia sp. PS1209]